MTYDDPNSNRQGEPGRAQAMIARRAFPDRPAGDNVLITSLSGNLDAAISVVDAFCSRRIGLQQGPVSRPPRRPDQPGRHQRVEQIQRVVDCRGFQLAGRGQQRGGLAWLG